ncbi:MAG TPA: hypothetical protein VF808_02775 [Ktedonobacterales bacterium]
MATVSCALISAIARHVAPGPIEPGWLHTAGQIAGVLLMFELLLALLIFAALMFGLAYGMWWLSRNVVPVIGSYSEQAQHYIEIAESGTDRVAHGVATFHGARAGIAAGLRAFFLPSRAAHHTRPVTQPLPHAARPAPGAAARPEPPAFFTTAAHAARTSPAPVASRPARPSAPRVAGRASGMVAGRIAGS